MPDSGSVLAPSQGEESFDRLERPRFDLASPRSPHQPPVPSGGHLDTTSLTQGDVVGDVLERVVQGLTPHEPVDVPEEAAVGSVAELCQQRLCEKEGLWTVSLTQHQASGTLGGLICFSLLYKRVWRIHSPSRCLLGQLVILSRMYGIH